MTTTRTPWIPNGDLTHLCALLYAMAANNERITTLSVLEQYNGSDRTDKAMNQQLRRLENSMYGCAFKSDTNNVARMNTNRQALTEAGFEFDGDIILSSATILAGSKHQYTGTGSDACIPANDDFTHVFTVEKITKLDRWLNIKPYAAVITNTALAQICGVSIATVARYRNSGKGYENGPPLVFIQQVEAAIDVEFFDRNFIHIT